MRLPLMAGFLGVSLWMALASTLPTRPVIQERTGRAVAGSRISFSVDSARLEAPAFLQKSIPAVSAPAVSLNSATSIAPAGEEVQSSHSFIAASKNANRLIQPGAVSTLAKRETAVVTGSGHSPSIPKHAASAAARKIQNTTEQIPQTYTVLASVTPESSVRSAASITMTGAIAEVATEVMVFCKDPGPQPLATTWTMFNVSPKVGQADCHLLEFPDGKKVLIDAAEGYDAPGVVMSCLRKAGITHLDLVVLSHVHWDHYGRLIDIIDSGISVDRVAVNLPASREIADAEIPWGCNWDDVQAMLKALRDRNIPYWTPATGEKLLEVTQNNVTSTLEVVCRFDGINTPVGRTDVNDTSMLVRLRHGNIKALFTGDLNYTLGAWLATSSFDLSADLLKVPHHGTDGLAPNEFFDRVAPKAAFVPSPRELWYSLRSKRARTYFSDRGIPTYVSGVHGTVVVSINQDSYEVTTSGIQ